MSSTGLLAQAEANPAQAEEIYKRILVDTANSDAEDLRDKETALVKLGELYRDQKYGSHPSGVRSSSDYGAGMRLHSQK